LEGLEMMENKFEGHKSPDPYQSPSGSPEKVKFEDEVSPRQQSSRSKYSAFKTYKQLDFGMSSPLKGRRPKSSNKKYSSIFENREQLKKQKDFFKGFKSMKKTDNMWKYNIKNHYHYYILKI
jgi:hypothetical protein